MTAAITAAFNIISGYVGSTIVEDDNEDLDTAALILARKILERGRISVKQKTQDTPADYVDNVIPKEVRFILDRYISTTATITEVIMTNQHPSEYNQNAWRS